MSDLNLRTNSSIELSDIRKLDILLTQCETSSCENICNDCCARLGSLEDDDDTTTASGALPSMGHVEPAIAKSPMKIISSIEHLNDGREMISNVPYVTGASTPTPTDREEEAQELLPLPQIVSSTPLSSGNANTDAGSGVKGPQPFRAVTKYCTKCGGLKSDANGDFSKKRYFSLDKERVAQHNSNLLNCSQDDREGSENLLSGCRKQCSFEDRCGKSDCKAKHNECMIGGGDSLKSPPSKKGSHRSDNTNSNRSLKDKSNQMSSKSSQNSLKDNRSRKNSMFCGLSDRDSSFRSKFSTQHSSRKFSTKGPLNLNEETDAETREILLGTKFDSFQELLKLPEPVEVVGFFF